MTLEEMQPLADKFCGKPVDLEAATCHLIPNDADAPGLDRDAPSRATATDMSQPVPRYRFWDYDGQLARQLAG